MAKASWIQRAEDARRELEAMSERDQQAVIARRRLKMPNEPVRLYLEPKRKVKTIPPRLRNLGVVDPLSVYPRPIDLYLHEMYGQPL